MSDLLADVVSSTMSYDENTILSCIKLYIKMYLYIKYVLDFRTIKNTSSWDTQYKQQLETTDTSLNTRGVKI